MDVLIEGEKVIKGTITPPPDKSISHRGVILGAISEGSTRIERFLPADDCKRTVDCFRKMGVDIKFVDETTLIIKGAGLKELKKPETILDAGNSGTTMRLLSGILAGQDFEVIITGDESLKKRPMERVALPLRLMGAKVECTVDGKFAPLKIRGGRLKGISYEMPVASAQVKSAVLLAGLYADGETTVVEKHKTRDHTERMLSYFGGNVTVKGNQVTVAPVEKLTGSDVVVPGDISSAAFFMVAAAINEGSKLLIKDVGVNPTRTGIIDVLLNMGCSLKVLNERELNGEKIADILIEGGGLKGTRVEGDIIPRLIDEIPVIAVAACFAEGETVIKNASELRVKESDRIKAMVQNLRRFGAKIEELEDGMVIEGSKNLKPAEVESFKDHRIAMAMAVTAISVKGISKIKDAYCVAISFPGFFDILNNVVKGGEIDGQI
ncbi:3-phosphoshikimate 1-carboxyvinyltransferase [Thermovenabulum sp.]|uniref:3-phosphoshikimate 1-carboxyvinyltransferase n=1 Tax=Thermovenabulum sp. TaxID=3100335 RepID=UPI003C7D34C4